MHLKRLIATTMISGAFLTVVGAASAFAAVQGVVNGTNVNVRAGASTDSEVVSVLDQNKTLTILGKQNDWYEVSFDTVGSAFISGQFVKITNADGSVTGDGVNIRISADPDADIVSTVNSGDAVNIIGQAGNWYQLSMNNGQAFIYKDYVSGDLLAQTEQVSGGDIYSPKAPVETAAAATTTTYALVLPESGLKLRSGATTDSESIRVLPMNEVLDVLEPGAEWVKVKTESNEIGYVSTEFISIRTGEKPSRSTGGSKGDQIIAYAKQFIGTPYSWGGTNLNSGVDCSGFVYAVFKNFGISLQRSSADMAVSNGVPVDKSQLIAGDLVFFDTTGPNDGGVSHVGIYVGEGQYIHSSSGKAWGVVISNLNDDYSLRTYVSARRVLR